MVESTGAEKAFQVKIQENIIIYFVRRMNGRKERNHEDILLCNK